MDEQTMKTLPDAGWTHSAMMDSYGRPCWAWQRGTDYFHVYEDSLHRITSKSKVVRLFVGVR